MYLIIALYALLASSFIIAKKAISYADPFFLIGFRMIIAGSILLIYNWIKKPTYFNYRLRMRKISALSWYEISKVTLFHIYFSFVLEFWALQYVSASKTILLYSLTPFISGILSYFLCNEVLSRNQLIGIVIGFLAIIDINQINFEYVSLPELMLLIAIACGAYAWFIIQKLTKKGHSISDINGISMFCGGILSLLTWYLTTFSSPQKIPVNDWSQFLIWIVLLIILSNIIVYNLYGYLTRYYSITFISFIGFFCPIFGTLFDALLFGSKICIKDCISIFLLIIALYFFCNDIVSMKLKLKHLFSN